jgi:hypothetical protein
MSIMDYLKLLLTVATMAPVIVKDVKGLVAEFRGDDTAVAVIRTIIKAVKEAVEEVEAILPSETATKETENG